MIEVIKEKIRKANKEHSCMASDFLLGSCLVLRNQEEIKAIELAKSKGFTIQAGEKYLHQVNKFDGRIYSFRAIPAIHEIVLKYNLYDE